MTQTTHPTPNPVTIRSHRPEDIDWIVSRHADLYAKEYAWNDKFTALVAKIASDFQQNHDPALEHCWIAETTGINDEKPRSLGTIMLVKEPGSANTAKLRLLLVEPSARGMGVGRSLIGQCIAFAREKGYERLVLWTQSILTSARRLYTAEGFKLVKEEEHEGFGERLMGEYYEMAL